MRAARGRTRTMDEPVIALTLLYQIRLFKISISEIISVPDIFAVHKTLYDYRYNLR